MRTEDRMPAPARLPRPRHRCPAWRAASTATIAVAAASQLGATDCGAITRDPGFDLWCSDALCAWKVERGAIRRVPTWHEADSGVELVDPGTAIEQFTPVNSGDGTCIQFDLISNVDETAQAELAVDIYGDGSVERTFEIPTAPWQPVSYAFAVKPPFTGIRFEIAKRGPGHAVVARMRAAVVKDGCAGLPELDGGPAPLGALCGAPGDCASGICAVADIFGTRRCTGCPPFQAGACGAGQTCGYTDPGPPERGVPIACVPAAARALGEQCLDPAECASGICNTGVCSTCQDNEHCGGAACQEPYEFGPALCAPGKHLAARGAPCATDADCASGACSGPARLQCADGRACLTDANCPVDSDLVPGACTSVGVQGGSCI
jgi:hypothetical protein